MQTYSPILLWKTNSHSPSSSASQQRYKNKRVRLKLRLASNSFIDDPFIDEMEESPETENQDNGPLFYAYARRTDNYWASRYLLTFVSATICDEWWSLVQSEYPNQAVRHGPQLFSFQGDNFFSKPASSKKFEKLQTKWFYTQFGDATGTQGRAQDIVPFQDWDGQILGGAAAAPTKGVDKGKGRADADDNDESSSTAGVGAGDGGKGLGPGFDMSALVEALHSSQAMLETNNAQIAQLAESQGRDQERMERVERMLEENAKQMASVTRSHVQTQEQNRVLAEQNAKLIRELRKQRITPQTQATTTAAAAVPAEQQTQGEGCAHNVHPPPRKLDKHLIGYVYEKEAKEAAEAASKMK